MLCCYWSIWFSSAAVGCTNSHAVARSNDSAEGPFCRIAVVSTCFCCWFLGIWCCFALLLLLLSWTLTSALVLLFFCYVMPLLVCAVLMCFWYANESVFMLLLRMFAVLVVLVCKFSVHQRPLRCLNGFSFTWLMYMLQRSLFDWWLSLGDVQRICTNIIYLFN